MDARRERIVFARITDTAADGGYGERRIAFVDPNGSDLAVMRASGRPNPGERPGTS